MSEQFSFYYPVEVFDENLTDFIVEGCPIVLIQEAGSRVQIGTVGAVERIENRIVAKGVIHD